MGRHHRPGRVAAAAGRIRRALGTGPGSLATEQQLALALWAAGAVLSATVGIIMSATTGDPAPLIGGLVGANIGGAVVFAAAFYTPRYRR